MNAVAAFLKKPGRETANHLIRRIKLHARESTRELTLLIQPMEQTGEYCGFRIHFSRGNTVVAEARREGVFEPDLSAALAAELRRRSKSPILIDIGANIGLISLYALKYGGAGKIFAFEPGSSQAKHFRQTVEANDLARRVHLEELALADFVGTAEFRIHRGRDNSGDGLFDTGWTGHTTAVQVQVNKLDNWWNANGRCHVDCIKIDTEGAELLVLRGAREMISSLKPTIFLEIAPQNMGSYPYTAPDYFSFFSEIGYKLSNLGGEVLSLEQLMECLTRDLYNYMAHPASVNPTSLC